MNKRVSINIHRSYLRFFSCFRLEELSPGLQMAFIDGNQTERLCEPMKQYIEERGGQVLLNQPLASLLAKFSVELPGGLTGA